MWRSHEACRIAVCFTRLRSETAARLDSGQQDSNHFRNPVQCLLQKHGHRAQAPPPAPFLNGKHSRTTPKEKRTADQLLERGLTGLERREAAGGGRQPVDPSPGEVSLRVAQGAMRHQWWRQELVSRIRVADCTCSHQSVGEAANGRPQSQPAGGQSVSAQVAEPSRRPNGGSVKYRSPVAGLTARSFGEFSRAPRYRPTTVSAAKKPRTAPSGSDATRRLPWSAKSSTPPAGSASKPFAPGSSTCRQDRRSCQSSSRQPAAVAASSSNPSRHRRAAPDGSRSTRTRPPAAAPASHDSRRLPASNIDVMLRGSLPHETARPSTIQGRTHLSCR